MNQNPETELISVAKAAEYLSVELPAKTAKGWVAWLANNRSATRSVSFRVPFSKLSRGEVFYDRAELGRFVEFEKALNTGAVKLSGRVAEAMRGFGLGVPGATSQGREWKEATVTLQTTNGGGVHVSFIIREPMAVFRMTPEQAMALASDLQETAQAANRIINNTPRTDLQYRTVMDNRDILVERLVVPKEQS